MIINRILEKNLTCTSSVRAIPLGVLTCASVTPGLHNRTFFVAFSAVKTRAILSLDTYAVYHI